MIGGPPTLEFDRCDEFSAPCGEPTVVGKARFIDGRYEWVVMTANEGVCFFTERTNRTGGSGGGGCGPHLRPSRGDPLNLGWSGPERGPGARAPKATHVGGPAILDAAEVRVIFRRRGERRVRRAKLFHVDGGFAEQLEVEPFAYWGRSIAGCLPATKVRARAFDAEGKPLGLVRPPRFLPAGCR